MRNRTHEAITGVVPADFVDRFARLYHAYKRAPFGTVAREEAREQYHAAAVAIADILAFELLGPSWYENSQAHRFIPSLPAVPNRGLALLRSGGSRG